MFEIREARFSKIGKVYQKDGNMVARKIAGELILVPIRQEAGQLAYFYSLNPVAARIWALLDGKRPVADIALTIVEEFEVDLERATKDTLRFASRLEELKMVIPVEGEA
ncbi:MAG: PqqD family protein [Chloroflexi bacterium]|nr:PqqD family protein [Chloroflexota bacterium]